MASNVVSQRDGGTNVTHFILTGEVLPKCNDNKLITTTESSKTDEVGEDDVFANENETNRAANFPKKRKEIDDGATDNQDQLSSTKNNQNNQHEITSSQISTVIISSPQQESLTVGSITDNNHASTTPTTVSGTTRRPSYTSKAPSALTNLPKIEDINTSPQILQTYVTLHPSSLLEKRGSSSVFDHDLRPGNKDLLSLHGQASFESIDHDEYSNPGTPTSNVGGIPRLKEKPSNSRMRADVLSKGKWESAARANVLTVRCREQVAELHKDKFGSGSKGKCIKVSIV